MTYRSFRQKIEGHYLDLDKLDVKYQLDDRSGVLKIEFSFFRSEYKRTGFSFTLRLGEGNRILKISRVRSCRLFPDGRRRPRITGDLDYELVAARLRRAILD